MSKNDPETTHEIVIVRRRVDGDHDDHHGGVWKVAFADFMTAMMAFFLVLWIVNSTTKQTRSSLARYFNPIRLSDTTPARKGLNDPREVDFDAASQGANLRDKAENDATPPGIDKGKRRENESVETGPDRGQSKSSDQDSIQAHGAGRASDLTFPGMRRQSPVAAEMERHAGARPDDAAHLKAEIESRAGDAIGRGQRDSLTVREEPEGLLINLVDRGDIGTFAIGSANAEEKLLRLLEAIAGALKERPGALIVRGHTDARQFRTGGDDNWRLSFARAQAAFFGLVHGGLDEQRIERVEAYADRKPATPQSPNARENRRIEILLRRTAP